MYNVTTIESQDAGKDPSIIVQKDTSLIDPPIALTFCQSSRSCAMWVEKSSPSWNRRLRNFSLA